jgi:Family of unknown function (DUF6298)
MRRLILIALVSALVPAYVAAAAVEGPARGPLKPLKANGRYFADPSGRPVYLTGSHVWWNLVGGPTWKVDCRQPRPRPFEYGEYLDRLERENHNFIRMWTIELTKWRECDEDVEVALQPWLRTGPGTARDGRPRFDLTRFDPAYFGRLRARVRAAGARGIYVSIMLFEGWGLLNQGPWRWASHPFHGPNNTNGVEADLDGNGTGIEFNTLASARVRALQEAYVRKVVDTVYDLNNVLFEIANESGSYSTAWQYRMIRAIKEHERRKGKRRHPVGMTFQHPHGSNANLYRSPADWISPFGQDNRYLHDPPVAPARKVSISDTDHHCGLCGDGTFPWRNFLRGHNVIHMDDFTAAARNQPVRSAMGQTRRYAQRLDLRRTRPRPELASTGYCLASPGSEYLAYAPAGRSFTVDLRGPARSYAVEWFDPGRDRTSRAGTVQGGSKLSFTPPFAGPAVLYLRRA